MLTLEQVRRLKEVLRATSAPLSFESFPSFAEAVLNPLIDLVGGQGGNLYITDVKASQKPLFLWHTYDCGLVPEYQGRFFKESPIHLMVPKRIRVGQTCQYVDYDQFMTTAFYNEFLAPRRIHHMATLIARLPEQGRSEGGLGILGLHRDPEHEAFSADELEILDFLYNPVEGALHTLLLAGSERQHLEQAFRALPVGVLVLNWKLERVYTNPALDEAFGEQRADNVRMRGDSRARGTGSGSISGTTRRRARAPGGASAGVPERSTLRRTSNGAAGRVDERPAASSLPVRGAPGIVARSSESPADPAGLRPHRSRGRGRLPLSFGPHQPADRGRDEDRDGNGETSPQESLREDRRRPPLAARGDASEDGRKRAPLMSPTIAGETVAG